MGSALNQVARILTGNEDAEALGVPWAELRTSTWARYGLTWPTATRRPAPTPCCPRSAVCCAVPGGLASWTRRRTCARRALSSGEIRALFEVCAFDRGAAGSRDAAAFALMFGAGLRRSDAASVQLDDYDLESGDLTITASGDGASATVQALAGHQSPATTARYDRRGERVKKKAAQMLVVPYQPPRID